MAAEFDRRLVGHGGAGDLGERAVRDGGLEALAADGRVELGLLDGEAVGVGGDHPEFVAGGGDEHAGEDEARRVAGGGLLDLRDGVAQGAGGELHRVLALERRQRRHVVVAQGAELELAAPDFTETKPVSSLVSSTVGAGRARATSRSSLPGSAMEPEPPTVAGSSVRIARSESTASSATEPDWATRRTPAMGCIALRPLATRETAVRRSTRSAVCELIEITGEERVL